MASRRSDEPDDDGRHPSRAPAYWDDAPTDDVLATSVWESPPRAALPAADPPPEPEPEEPEAPVLPAPPEGWFRSRQTQLMWIALFLAGALLGGAAVHSWEAQAAEAARRDTVALSARVSEDAASSASWTGARQPWTLRIVVTNNGPSDVRIRDAKLADGRYRSNLRTVSRDVRVPHGQETWISLDVTHSCDKGGPASAPRELALTVQPTGRAQRDLKVRLADDTTLLVETARQKCQSPASDLWITAELAGDPADLGTELATSIRIRQQMGNQAMAVREIHTPTPGLSVIARPLPVEFVEDLTPQTTLRWSVADCAKARVIVFAEVGVTGILQLAEGGASLRVPIVLDANAVLAIVRFITRSCG